MQQSDTSSVTSKTSEKKKHPYFPLVKKSTTEIALAFDPRNLENREGREGEKKGTLPRMMNAQEDNTLFFYHNFKSSRTAEEDTISIRNKDGRILVQGERSDLKTQYYAFVRECNCSRPCEAKKCRHPVYFVHKIKAIYNGKTVNSRESDLIRRSERDSSTVDIKEENAATDLLLKQIKSTPLGKEVENQFKKIEEGYEGDQGEMTFKKSRKRAKKSEEEEEEEDKMLKLDEDVNPNDEVDAEKFSDDSDNDREVANDAPEGEDAIWDEDSMEDSDDKNKDKAPEHLSESESDSDEEDNDSEEEEEMEVENGELEKKQFGNILRELFRRYGNKIRIKQMSALISNALGSNRPLAEWYQHYTKQVKGVFDNLCKRNDQSGFYEFRGFYVCCLIRRSIFPFYAK